MHGAGPDQDAFGAGPAQAGNAAAISADVAVCGPSTLRLFLEGSATAIGGRPAAFFRVPSVPCFASGSLPLSMSISATLRRHGVFAR